MSEPVLTVLKLCFLAVLYLFVARVVRAVWVEIFTDRQPSPEPARAAADGGRTAVAPGPADGRRRNGGRRDGDASRETGDGRKGRHGRRSQAERLVIVEPPEQRGTSFALADEMTLGRGAGCAVCVSDTFASGLHARVFRREGLYFLEDLGSTNGTWLNRKRVTGPLPLHPGDRVQIGNTVLELRS